MWLGLGIETDSILIKEKHKRFILNVGQGV
jgi:hypothetical protein